MATSVGELVFNSLVEACSFAETKEHDYDSVTVMTNTPKPGLVSVRWGQIQDRKGFGKVYGPAEPPDWELIAQRRFEQACEEGGRRLAGEQLAAARGYKGRDAEVFTIAFCVSGGAKYVNSRQEGRGKIWRDGKTARGTEEGTRAVRVATVQMRSIIEKPTPENLEPLIWCPEEEELTTWL